MNYQHAFHAGNFADVVKHILLLQLLQQLSQKPKPFYVLDAYGGRGLYSLSSEESKKTGEAINGVDKLLHSINSQPESTPLMASPVFLLSSLDNEYNPRPPYASST